LWELQASAKPTIEPWPPNTWPQQFKPQNEADVFIPNVRIANPKRPA
jgi:hypothetical protein